MQIVRDEAPSHKRVSPSGFAIGKRVRRNVQFQLKLLAFGKQSAMRRLVEKVDEMRSSYSSMVLPARKGDTGVLSRHQFPAHLPFQFPDALGGGGRSDDAFFAVAVKLPVNFGVGFSAGAGVLIARHYGAKKREMLSRAAHTAITFALAAGLLFSVLGILLSPALAGMLNVPDDIAPMTPAYVRITFGALSVSEQGAEMTGESPAMDFRPRQGAEAKA